MTFTWPDTLIDIAVIAILSLVLRGVLTDRPAMEWDRIDVPQGVVFRIGNGRETVLH